MRSELTATAVLQALSRHIGAKNGAHAVTLAAEAVGEIGEEILTELEGSYYMRQLREIVVQLRLDGHHICATPEDGYFMAATPEELDRTCLFLHERAMTTLKQIAAMKRVSLPDLKGQLHLPT